jgi:hypothetical protein
MNDLRTEKSDNLSDFSAELKKIEETYIKDASVELAQARNSVVGAISGLKQSRMNLGRVLRTYKGHFKAERAWTAAMKVIAGALQCDERTVYRIIEDYERASRLPEITLEVMVQQKIDPAAAKNAAVVEKLLEMPKPTTRKEAGDAVIAVVKEHHARKRLLRTKQTASKSAAMDVEAFAERIVRQFEDRYRSMAPEQRDAEVRYVLEKVANTLRANVSELRQFSRPALVPKPVQRKAA